MVSRVRASIATYAFLVAIPTLSAAAATLPTPQPLFGTVSTIAGSGAVGTADGSAQNAQFMFPTGVAEDASGTIYVADYAGQRIRKIARDGSVTTLAGGGQPDATGLYVPGGRVNGPALQARFYSPMGVAVDARGTVYVADGVHVIRKIQSGTVSIYAGSSDEGGDRLGPALTVARFRRPVGVAVDSDGNVYVADIVLGIREITASGDVVVPPIDKGVEHPCGIAIYDVGGVRSFAIADSLGILYISPKGEPLRIASNPGDNSAITHGEISPGYPAGVVMLGPHDIAYTDPRTNTIRFWSAGEERVIAGAASSYDGEHAGGGYRDGPGDRALFEGPIGITSDRDGGLIVADAGSRRIRKIGPFDRRRAVDPVYGGLPTVVPGVRHVLLIGNSFVQWDAPWPSSIGGVLESELNRADPKNAVQVISVSSGGLSTQAQRQYIEEVCADLPIDYAVYLENSSTALISYPPAPGTESSNPWIGDVASDLRAMTKALPQAANSLVVINPYAWEFSPAGSTYHRLFFKFDGEFLSTVSSFHEALAETATRAGLPLLDLWPVLEAADASPSREPYFATNEAHFSLAGDELAGRTIARTILADPKWRARRNASSE